MLPSTHKVLQLHAKVQTTERLGQWFVNRYVKKLDATTDNLFNMTDTWRTTVIIDQWMKDNCYMVNPPMPLSRGD